MRRYNAVSVAASLKAVALLVFIQLATCRHSVRAQEQASESVQGLHTALNGESAVRIIWRSSLVQHSSSAPLCQYGSRNGTLDKQATGSSYTYTAGGFNGSLHEVIIDGIKANGSLFYRCGAPGAFSPEYDLRLKSPGLVGGESLPWIGVIGDMGIEESEYTLASLMHEVRQGLIQMVVHAGDISYANNYEPSSTNSWVWEKFFADMQPIATAVPYMTTPGNHEAQFDFAGYLNWLHMPHAASGSSSPFYHSFDYLGVHFTMFSTEHDFSNGSAQQQWIHHDLVKASQNRNNVPWIVVVGHRPLYCSSVAVIERCIEEAPIYRSQLEWLLHLYHVDIYICGHNHQYERSYPVYNMEVTSHDYNKPTATVYIVNGAAGDIEHVDPTFLPEFLVPWRAAHGHLRETSWLRMQPNSSSLKVQLVRSQTNEVQDEFVITR